MNIRRQFCWTMLATLMPVLFTQGALGQDTYGSPFRDTLRSGGTGPELIEIPSGSFLFGGGRGKPGDPGMIRISTIALGTKEVTVGEYRQFLAASRSREIRNFKVTDETLPVAGISFDAAEAYVTWLSHQTGKSYRLPSSSEWEYAARAGSTLTYSWGDELGENLANCTNCGSEFTGALAPVGSFPPNGWGLYDMHGNVWEWTKDCVDPNSAPPPDGLPQLFGNCDSRELRGGSAEADGWSIRANARAFAPRQMRSGDVGFRVVRELD